MWIKLNQCGHLCHVQSKQIMQIESAFGGSGIQNGMCFKLFWIDDSRVLAETTYWMTMYLYKSLIADIPPTQYMLSENNVHPMFHPHLHYWSHDFRVITYIILYNSSSHTFMKGPFPTPSLRTCFAKASKSIPFFPAEISLTPRWIWCKNPLRKLTCRHELTPQGPFGILWPFHMNIKLLPRRGCAVHRNSSHRSAGTPHRSQHTTEVMDTHLYSFYGPSQKDDIQYNTMTLYQALVFKTKQFACLGLSWRTPLHLDQLFVLLCTCEVFLGTNRLKAVSIILDSRIQLSKAHTLRLPTPNMSAMLFSWLTASVHRIHKAISAARKTSTSELLALFYVLILLGDILGPKCIQLQPCRICNFFFQNFLEASGAVRPFSCDNTIQLSNMLPWLWQWSLPELPTFSSTPGYPRAAAPKQSVVGKKD